MSINFTDLRDYSGFNPLCLIAIFFVAWFVFSFIRDFFTWLNYRGERKTNLHKQKTDSTEQEFINYIQSLSEEEQKQLVDDFYTEMMKPHNLKQLKKLLTDSLFKRS